MFSAALQQSEELFEAANSVGPASKPLPLFYALGQAGRAITAAHNPDESTWSYRSHGLSVRTNRADVRETNVKANPSKCGDDAASSVAAALGSAPLTGSVTLAALAAFLPELADCRRLHGSELPALEITPEADLSEWWHPLTPGARGTVFAPVETRGDLDALLARARTSSGACGLIRGTRRWTGT